MGLQITNLQCWNYARLMKCLWNWSGKADNMWFRWVRDKAMQLNKCKVTNFYNCVFDDGNRVPWCNMVQYNKARPRNPNSNSTTPPPLPPPAITSHSPTPPPPRLQSEKNVTPSATKLRPVLPSIFPPRLQVCSTHHEASSPFSARRREGFRPPRSVLTFSSIFEYSLPPRSEFVPDKFHYILVLNVNCDNAEIFFGFDVISLACIQLMNVDENDDDIVVFGC
ncbi:uncharacterized protein LOC131658883 [Vicia villosa]|uniref:uncharacterized protein LOC131658883 n=1 Tax=Vicia villosa TaxID=3911 RepID=UPI00273B2014|nr:uncharacterized protein LOC131658883 [Vicia villosa]